MTERTISAEEREEARNAILRALDGHIAHPDDDDACPFCNAVSGLNLLMAASRVSGDVARARELAEMLTAEGDLTSRRRIAREIVALLTPESERE